MQKMELAQISLPVSVNTGKNFKLWMVISM